MRTMRVVIAAVAAGVVLVGCTNIEERPKASIGAVLGAVGGGLIGSQFGSGTGQILATTLGVLGGAYLGHALGGALDEADRLAADSAREKALADNRRISWSNPETSRGGDVRPTNTFAGPDGRLCREYEFSVLVDGRRETGFRRACQGADGIWRDV